MNRTACLWCGLCGLLLTACISSEPPVIPSKTNSPVVTQPPELPVFGEAGPGKIKVKVTGEVKRPGIYYLKANAVISDALEAAQGRTEFFYWPASTLVRTTTEVVGLNRKDTIRPLKDGDWLIGRHGMD